jgi:hypothetical protein
MTPDEIRNKSLELAALYTAKANGRTLQIQTAKGSWIDFNPGGWSGSTMSYGPNLASELSRWRVKPEPRRMWETPSASSFTNNHNVRTHHQNEADEWRAKGYKVTEWQEVIP